jgi:glycosyltransferase involved in cell wall biosynthesis
MRIGIDARFYGSLGKGLGRYTERLIAHLEDLAHEDTFVIFLRKENWDAFRPKSGAFRKVLADFRWYSLTEQRRMPALVKASGIDLMHYPHFNVPVLAPKPFVVTIHDLILTHFPTRRATTLGPITYAIKQTAYRIILSRAVARASHILTVSNFTKNDIQKYFGYDPKKITVAYEAVDPFPEFAGDQTSVLNKFGIKEKFLLYVGNAYPHKNLEQLIPFIKGLPPHYSETKMVIIGKPDYFLNRLMQQVKDAGLSSRFIFPGYVSDIDLGILYNQAQAFIFPSLYEGFGLPPLEAMVHGTPVLSSDAACMREVLGDAAIYFNPRDTRAMIAALEQLDTNPEMRRSLVAAGRQHASEFSWKQLASTTLQTYHNIQIN